MKTLQKLVALCLAFFAGSFAASAQNGQTPKYAVISLPSEIEHVAVDDENLYVNTGEEIWEVKLKTAAPKVLFKLTNAGWMTRIQAMGACHDKLIFYVNGKGLYYKTISETEPHLMTTGEVKFKRNYEEAYSDINVADGGTHMTLFGGNENAVVFSLPRLSPIAVFNEWTYDAYYDGGALWARVPNMVVINERKGESLNNYDCIYYGKNDQHNMTKLYYEEKPNSPGVNFGENEHFLALNGEPVALVQNKVSGHFLLGMSSWGQEGSSIYRIDRIGTKTLLNHFPNTLIGDFAVHGDNLVIKSGGGFFFTKTNAVQKEEVKFKPLVTNIMMPPAWKGHKPDPYKTYGGKTLRYDKHGNLWIIDDRTVFVYNPNGLKKLGVLAGKATVVKK